MALEFADLVKQHVVSQGADDFTLGDALEGWLTLDDAEINDGATVHYAAATPWQRETGEGVYTAATKTVTRATIDKSTSSNAKVDFAEPPVFAITFLASDAAGVTTEGIQDIVGAMFSGNTETNITVTYQDGDGTIDLVVDDVFLSNSGDVGTGTYDFGGADSFELPNSAAPTVDADGEIALDTSVTDFSHGVLKYWGGEEMAVIAVPIAQLASPTDNYAVMYDAAADEFQLQDPAAASGATQALDNLASVAINTSLISDTDITDDLGTGNIRWNAGYFATLNAGLTANDTLILRARDVDGASWTDFITITSANAPTCDLADAVTHNGSAILDAADIGATVQAQGAVLDDLNTLGAPTADGEFLVATGAGAFAYETGATVLTSLGLGTGDSPQFTGVNIGHASDTTLTRASAGVAAIEGNNIYTSGTDIAAADGGTIGQQTVNLLTAGMVVRATNGPTSYETEKATNDVMVSGYEFSASVDQALQIHFPMPKGWDGGTIVAKFYWTTSDTAGTGNVVLGIRARAAANDEAVDGSWGTAVTVTDGFLADGDQHQSAEASAMTIGNTPAAEDMIYWEVYRDADNASDTYTQTIVLQAVMIHYTLNSGTDD